MSLFRTDPALLLAFREGRREALERIYRNYVRAIDRYVRALARASGILELAQPSAVADLVQEIFLRAFSASGRRSYDGLREYGPYLTTITRNCFIDALRTRGREVLKPAEELSLVLDESVTEPDGWCDPGVLAVLNAYVSGLPARLNGVYEQRFVLGRSQEEASAVLGVSRGQLRTEEKRLRVGLRKALVRAGISLRELRETPVDLSTTIPARPTPNRSGA